MKHKQDVKKLGLADWIAVADADRAKARAAARDGHTHVMIPIPHYLEMLDDFEALAEDSIFATHRPIAIPGLKPTKAPRGWADRIFVGGLWFAWACLIGAGLSRIAWVSMP